MQDLEWNFGLKIFLLLEQTSPTCSMLLTLFYWSVLYDPADLDADNVLRHGGNVAVLLVNSFASQAPFVSYHVIATMIVAVTYTLFQWAYFGISGNWVYQSLGINTESMGAMLYYAALPVLFTISFYLWCAAATPCSCLCSPLL